MKLSGQLGLAEAIAFMHCATSMHIQEAIAFMHTRL